MRTSDIGPDIEEITMNVGIIQLVHRLNENVNYSVSTVKDMYDEIHMKITRYIVEDHQKTIKIIRPKGWWQQLKQDYLTGIANYFPVKTETIEINAKIYYPNIAIPNEQAYVKFYKCEGVNNHE